ncbi:hypothetical protein C4552_01100 [Candidatus Parcubacteria bacterium]|nr:MAG: hypothetical protein C4552_01100 [Candidatus Parcubacteria bacterium]
MTRKIWIIAGIGIALMGIATVDLYISSQRVNPVTKAINPAAYGPLCGQISGTCNGIVAINCHAEMDGPFYYVDEATGDIISTCGGECLFGTCEGQCPPAAWTCR